MRGDGTWLILFDLEGRPNGQQQDVPDAGGAW